MGNCHPEKTNVDRGKIHVIHFTFSSQRMTGKFFVKAKEKKTCTLNCKSKMINYQVFLNPCFDNVILNSIHTKETIIGRFTEK